MAVYLKIPLLRFPPAVKEELCKEKDAHVKLQETWEKANMHFFLSNSNQLKNQVKEVKQRDRYLHGMCVDDGAILHVCSSSLCCLYLCRLVKRNSSLAIIHSHECIQ